MQVLHEVVQLEAWWWVWPQLLPQVVPQLLQLSQQSCLLNRPRSRSNHDGLSQQLVQEGWQQVVGQQL